MPPPPEIIVDFSIEVDDPSIDCEPLAEAVRRILGEANFQSGQISIAVVDDPMMHDLNRRYLNHDYPTDVLSFFLEGDDTHLEGQLIVSLDTARKEAEHYGWQTTDELLLYVIHGTLHLVGYDDSTDAARSEMRARERDILAWFDLEPHNDESVTVRTDASSPSTNPSHNSGEIA